MEINIARAQRLARGFLWTGFTLLIIGISLWAMACSTAVDFDNFSTDQPYSGYAGNMAFFGGLFLVASIICLILGGILKATATYGTEFEEREAELLNDDEEN